MSVEKSYRIILFIVIILSLSSCNMKDNTNETQVTKWDNTKYADWDSSVGLDVYNSNSFDEINGDLYKANSVLYITNINEPITLKFNNNGKDRNFALTAYYDYKQIPFRISETGEYSEIYKFDLEDSYEIEIPFYLPNDLETNGDHKLLISFSIGHDFHAKDLETLSDWYGMSMVYDLTFDQKESFDDFHFRSPYSFEEPQHIIDNLHTLTLNTDYNFDIISSDNAKTDNLLTVKKGTPFDLVYNAASPLRVDNIALIVTFGYKQTSVDGQDYKLINIPSGKTGVGTIKLTAPDETGLYEVIALSAYNPLGKKGTAEKVRSSVRFTLNVTE